jgi:putative Mg2+ transporter-C (MgtC) family protein
MPVDVAELKILGLVTLAMILGALIGFERESADKPAGLRTHILVAGASAFLVGIADVIVIHIGMQTGSDLIRSDPIRIVEAIITGVSFLGAGTIIYHRSEKNLEGLTTAASVLVAAGVGLAIGLSQFLLGIGMALLTLLVLRGVSYLEEHI